MAACGKTFLRLAACLVVAVVASGCVANVAGSLTLPADVAAQGSYFVERRANDERDIASVIAERMRARGLNAAAGVASDRRAEQNYVVTYVDRWFWDMRMYLADLRIEIRDAQDQSIVGFGQSSQSSLAAMGQSYADVVDTALDQLFGAR